MTQAPEDLSAFLTTERTAAIAWATEVLADDDAVYIDTETTGLDERAEIIDIAVCDNAGRPLLDRLVRPRGHIPSETTAVHGITYRDVASEPTWPDVYEEVCRVLNAASRVIVYNVEYDLRILAQTTALYTLAPSGPPRDRFECAMEQYSRFMGKWDAEAGRFQRMKLRGGNHRAFGDCIATVECVRKMAAAGKTQGTMF